MSSCIHKSRPELDDPFVPGKKAKDRLRRWPRAGIRRWRSPHTGTVRFYVTFWDAPDVRHIGLFSVDSWFDSFNEADAHARLIIGAHHATGTTLNGRPNHDYYQ